MPIENKHIEFGSSKKISLLHSSIPHFLVAFAPANRPLQWNVDNKGFFCLIDAQKPSLLNPLLIVSSLNSNSSIHNGRPIDDVVPLPCIFILLTITHLSQESRIIGWPHLFLSWTSQLCQKAKSLHSTLTSTLWHAQSSCNLSIREIYLCKVMVCKRWCKVEK